MIIQALNEYYHRLSADPNSGVAPAGYSNAKVFFAFYLDLQGNITNVVPLYELKKNKKLGRDLLVPAQVKKTSGVNANFMCESSSYVLGVDNKGKPKRSEEAFKCFVDLHNEILSGLDDSGARAMLAFLNSRTAGVAEEPLLKNCKDDLLEGGNIVFRLEGESGYLHDRPAIKKAWLDHQDESGETPYIAQCLVIGLPAPIARLHPSIKGVRNAQSSGASIVSFNDSSYESYGKKQSYNAPVSSYATFAYTTALNYLLSSSKNNLQIGDSTTVFWAERPQEESMIAALFDPPEETAPPDDSELMADYLSNKKIRDILLQLRAGQMPNNADIDPEVHFSILGLAPNAARLAIRFYYQGEFGQLLRNVGQHFQDMAIIAPPHHPELPPVWRILRETAARNKTENIPDVITGNLMRSILSGNIYPRSVYSAMLTRIRADRDINSVRAGFIKAYLLRQSRLSQEKGEISLGTMLNNENHTPAYLLGRLFALLEKAQQDASGGSLNATIKDRFFGSASANPSRVFPQLINLYQNHISKLKKIKPGVAYALDKSIEEILIQIDPAQGFPSFLDLEQQGLFILGYYQQRQALYTKKETVDPAREDESVDNVTTEENN